MRLSLCRSEIECLVPVYDNTLTQEDSVEMVVSDVRDDVGKILDVRGQVLLKTVKPMTDSVEISAAVSVDAIYLSEGGDKTECISAEIPFQFSVAADGVDEQTAVMADLFLISTEAKMVNPRKLLFRSKISVAVKCYIPDTFSTCRGMPLTENGVVVHLQEKCANHSLVTAVREKTFSISDEYPLPKGVDASAKLISANSVICIDETKFVGNKLVFKARAVSDAVFQNEDNSLVNGSMETEFSQIIETDSQSDKLHASVSTQLMSCDFTRMPEGGEAAVAATFRVRAAALCLEDTETNYTSDAYSNVCNLETEVTDLDLALVSPEQTVRGKIEGKADEDTSKDRICYLALSEVCAEVSGKEIEIRACCTGIAKDEQESCIPVCVRLKGEISPDVPEGGEVKIMSVSCEKPEIDSSGNISADVKVSFCVHSSFQISAISAFEYDEENITPDAFRPSVVVLCSDSGADMWQLAKKYGSAVEAIEAANTVEGVFSPYIRPLLIPKVK